MRASVKILERLVDDLDAEVALLARGKEPARCLGLDSHTKLSPVAAMLRQQVYTLCGLISEQERHAERQRLLAESRQLARSQFDLGERLEHLLEQRESLVHTLRHAGELSLLRPQSPVAGHCQCDQHHAFLGDADSVLVGYDPLNTQESELRGLYESLQRRHEETTRHLTATNQEISDLEDRWQDLQRHRAGLVGNGVIEKQQAELERLEAAIRQALQSGERTPVAETGVWRASDILAQLSDGEYVQIRLDREDRIPSVIDRLGNACPLSSLSTASHDQLYLALTLALVGAFSRRGIQLPLVLDEPFLRQDAASSAAMAGVLAEFARSGQQVLVFTEDLDALHRFQTLHCRVFDVASLRQVKRVEVEEVATTATTFTRVVRETEDGSLTRCCTSAVMQTSWTRTITSRKPADSDEFPVFGADTVKIFAKLKIHTVGELLQADALVVADRLGRREIKADTVRLWQTHMELMCRVAGVSLNDALVLAACGIANSAALNTADADELASLIAEFLQSERGKRFAGFADRYRAHRLRKWVRSTRPVRTNGHANRNGHSRPQTKTQRTERTAKPAAKRPLRFYLNLESDVEAAPSIGPKTAEHLLRVGIRTVSDLLNSNPVSVAEELDMSHITATKLSEWQHQARLVCQIPELRGYAAQLLVACDLTSPEQIAAMRQEDLVRKINQLCKSKQGERILRTTDAPSAGKIKRWAANAALRRPLEAA